MHVDIARSFFTAAGRPHGRPAEPWPMPSSDLQASPAPASLLGRLKALARTWFG